jgi:hypothetical protein
MRQGFMQKCEIHLPLNYGDGGSIEQKKIDRVREELLVTFPWFAEPYQRTWRHDARGCTEILKIEVIITGDSLPKNQLKELKARLKEFLPQDDILITIQDVELV